jgi:hypothetical protein
VKVVAVVITLKVMVVMVTGLKGRGRNASVMNK